MNGRLARGVYRRLLSFHDRQGWWPLANPATGESEYHIGPPRDANDFLEIAIGAILTQSVSWKNAGTAVAALKLRGMVEPAALDSVSTPRLSRLIRSAGYYNQKAKKIKNFIAWYRTCGGIEKIRHKPTPRLRTELLAVNGIGPETADSILLYGLGRRVFVVDAYTRRIFERLGAVDGSEGYSRVQELFHRHFRGTTREYNEYHALIVAHGKHRCKKKPACSGCCLRDLCAFQPERDSPAVIEEID